MCKNDKRKMYKADDLEWWSELIETAQTYAGDMNLLARKKAAIVAFNTS